MVLARNRGDQFFVDGIGFPGLPSPLPSSQILGTESRGSITLAVDVAGSDVDPTRPDRLVSGDWSAKPFATLQAAVDAFAKLPHYDVTINVAAGTYAGFALKGYLGTKEAAGSQLTINGLVGLASVTGINTGTATSGTARTLTCTGAGWTPDELRGKLCTITAGPGAGQSFVIGQNTTDTLTFAAKMSPIPSAGSVFNIEEQKVELTQVGGFAILNVDGVYARMAFNDLKITGTATYKAICHHAARVIFNRCFTSGGFAGYYCVNTFEADFNQCYAQNSSYNYFLGGIQLALTSTKGMVAYSGLYGFAIQGVPFVSLVGVMCLNNTYGVLGTYCGQLGFTDLWVEGSITNGVYAQANTLLHFLGDTYIANCLGDPFNLYAVQVRLGGTLTGAGNTGYGVRCSKYNATINIDGGVTPTITGTLGDATVDGATALTWATDFGASGDFAANAASGARIYRS